MIIDTTNLSFVFARLNFFLRLRGNQIFNPTSM